MTHSMETGERGGIAGWFERLADRRGGLGVLFVASVLESTVVPFAIEAITLPLMLTRPARALIVALAIWLGSLAGAGIFYWVGSLLFDPVVLPVLEWVGAAQTFNDIQGQISGGGFFWSVFLISLSPAPMQLATLGAGTIGGNFLIFMLAVGASRGVRYFGMAVLAQLFGERVMDVLHRMKGSAWLLMLALLGIWLLIRFLPFP